MNKRVVIILVAILVVLIAAIAVIEIVKKDDNKGPDSLIVNSNGETGVVVDLETGSTIEDSSEIKDATTNDKILGNEVVGEQDMPKDDTSSDSSATSSDENTSSKDPNKQTMDGFSPWQ